MDDIGQAIAAVLVGQRVQQRQTAGNSIPARLVKLVDDISLWTRHHQNH